MDVEGVILCGGEGKRLRPLTYYFQKTMIPIGKKQKPLLEYIIKLFKHHKIRDIVLLVGYKNEQIRNYFEDGSRFGVNIRYVEDPLDVKGTGHALLNAFNQGYFNDVKNLMIYYGDILADINLREMMNTHLSRNAIATLAVASKYQVPVGVIKLSGDKVTGMIEKPWLDMNVSIGILILSTGIFPVLKTLSEKHRELDIMGHLIPRLLDDKAYIITYLHSGYWYDVGTTEKYEKIDNQVIDELFKNII